MVEVFRENHLTHAIGNEIKERFPEKNVFYVTNEFFRQQCVDAIENNNLDRLVDCLQLIDIFILEDVQFLSSIPRPRGDFINFWYIYSKRKTNHNNI